MNCLSYELLDYFSTNHSSEKIKSLLYNLGYWETILQESRKSDYDLLLKDLHFKEGVILEKILSDHNIKPIRIKSFSYPESSFPQKRGRRINDIDIWINNTDDYNYGIELAKQHSFKIYPQNRWEAANNRINIYKDFSFCKVYVDIHSALAWDLKSDFKWEIVKDPAQFYRLEDSHLILHLLINWIYQDGLVGLEKLIDMYFLLKNSLAFDTSKIISHAKKLKIAHTIDLGLAILKKFNFPQTKEYIPSQKSILLADKIFNSDFIFNPYRNKFLFIFLKHYVRKNISQALYYDCLKVLSSLRPKSSDTLDFK